MVPENTFVGALNSRTEPEKRPKEAPHGFMCPDWSSEWLHAMGSAPDGRPVFVNEL